MHRMRSSALHYSRSHPPTLEQLEDRTLLAGNLLITAWDLLSHTSYLMEYSPQGDLLNSQLIALPSGSSDTNPEARGLSVDPSGNVNIYDGTSTPTLATYSAANNSWTYLTASGWSTANNLSYGEVAAYKNFIFVSDMDTGGSGTDNGILRFNTTDGSKIRFAPGTDFIQVALGQDGLIYGLETNGAVQVYNPDTLAFVRSFTLQGGPDSNIRSIAVDGSGTILAATWGGYIAEYDATGSYTGTSIQLKDRSGNGEHLLNIALDTDGQVAVGSSSGDVFLTNESLSSPTAIYTTQTNPFLQNAFVTFDHYIGTQTVTPSFDALAGPTINYGQSSVTLGGRITAGNSYPIGSVNITVAGVTEAAAINSTDGTFSATFDTSALDVSGLPYSITYSYAGQGRFAAISDSSSSLTVNQATTSLINLSSPAMIVGTKTICLSGGVGSNSVLPVGQDVTVTLLGAKGTVTSASAVVNSDGSFQVSLNTGPLPVGSYTIQYSYAGDNNFTASNGTGTLLVTYAVCPVHAPSHPTHCGANLPILIRVSDASGHNLSSATLVVKAISLIGPNGAMHIPKLKGYANFENVFHRMGGVYVYKLDTVGLTPGTYTLLIQVGNDPVLKSVSFVIAAPKRWRH